MNYDAIIVGGSYAGMSAGLQLARARQKVAIVDTGKGRNRFAGFSHGFLSQDGRAPGDIAADARTQLLAYPTVEWIEGEAVKASGKVGDFGVRLANGRDLKSKILVLASGVSDTLPEIPGLAERWGKSVFHCPYCHGYELDQGPIGVIATGPASIHQALLLPDWGPTTFLLNGTFEPDAEQSVQLAGRGARIEAGRVVRITGRADVELDDGRTISFAGLFTASRTAPSTPLATQLGCRMEDGPLGEFIWTDAMKQTSVPGVLACGDAARGAGNVAVAVGDGAMAGAAAHRSLIFP
ncbi:NAD(P)/FAD-dependent oxidoreductase [Pelagibacterium limicola]|uniref:NAD(P)/FAD-dependent oxidoreductase n=1 Tax=Pelagibacterium limicola TaxID=2791022 RepID=UPI0018AFC3ED|nr:NAD(P)/FAD-dependent oxidoreductase [Pelagibacterium limicola]